MKNIYIFLFKSNISIYKTLLINFKMFSFSTAIKLPIYVFKNWRFNELKGEIIISSSIKRGMITFGQNIAGYVDTTNGCLRLKENSKIIFYGNAKISQGCQFFLNNNAILKIQDEVKFGDNVKLICYKSIEIGKMSELTWETQITDFNSHYIKNLNNNKISNIFRSVYIGSHCWIGNRTTILPGTVLPDRVIVTSNSLLNKNYFSEGIESYSIIGGLPARVIRKNVKRLYSLENEKILHDYFINTDCLEVTDSILENEEHNG